MKASDKRDREQKHLLIQSQLAEQRMLQDQYKAIKIEHLSVLQNLTEHTAHYLNLGRAVSEKPKSSDIQRSESNRTSRSFDKGRDKEPDR